MADTSGTVYDPDNEQVTLVTPNVPVKHVLGVYNVNVPMGQQHRLFKNGRHERDLTPGQHTWTDLNPFAQYTISEVDTRTHRSKPILAKGSLRGKPGEPPHPVDLPLRLTYQMGSIDTLLRTEHPLRALEAITQDQIANVLAGLRYDEQSSWETELRNQLQEWLRIYANERTGLQVLEVLIVGAAQGENAVDRATSNLYNVAREIEAEDLRREADRRNMVRNAQATAQAASIVNANADEMFLANTEGGRFVIAQHTLQEETRINALGQAGARPLLSEAPIAPAELPAAGGSSAASAPAASGPGRVSYPFPGDASSPAASSGASSEASSGAAGSAAPTPMPAPAFEPVLDRARVEAEVEQLGQQGYRVNHGPGQVSDAQGVRTYGYIITVFPGSTSVGGWKSVRFELGPGYPQTAPSVIVTPASAAMFRWDKDPILTKWTSFTRLTEVLNAVIRSL